DRFDGLARSGRFRRLDRAPLGSPFRRLWCFRPGRVEERYGLERSHRLRRLGGLDWLDGPDQLTGLARLTRLDVLAGLDQLDRSLRLTLGVARCGGVRRAPKVFPGVPG